MEYFKAKISWLSFVVITSVFLSLFGCGNGNDVKYKFTLGAESNSIDSQLERVNVFVETSVSMQGYVNTNVPGNYVLKEVVPYLIIDLDNQFNDAVNLYTITDQPRKVKIKREAFFAELTSGRIFGGKSSKLQDVFGAVIDSLDDASINIIISDCISDLGKINTMTEGPKISQTIYSHLSQKQGMGAAVFQYLSDFNGNYYFDRNNTGGNSIKNRPYYNTILNKRPLYIWVMGKKELVNQLLSQDIFRKYEKSHFYNLAINDINPQLLENPKKGKISINRDKQTIRIKRASAKRPVEFVIGVDLKDKPLFDKTLFSDVSHFKVSPSFLNKQITVETLDKTLLLEGKNVDKTFIEKNELTNFLKIKIKEVDANLDEFNIFLPAKGEDWFTEANLSDDLQIPAADLEGKTFAFKFITDAFDRYFENEEPLVKFNFIKIK